MTIIFRELKKKILRFGPFSKTLKNAFISEIMGYTIKVNRGKVVQRKISCQISLLKFWRRNMITEL